MSDFKRLSDSLSVSAQLSPDDLKAAATAGFKSIINNRPDQESADQPSSDSMANLALSLGMSYIHQPIVSGQISEENINDFAALIADSETPILAFCRTGTRCTHLWALSNAKGNDLSDIAASAAAAGYDISGLMPRLQQRKEG
ncbi:MAG: TIGR01244 family phosphatase [Gammaproteobacteria bacterium]|nr:TIGR01244 family phosphatase [Gammaproteobacteria bacterium]MBQ0774581.1 TIGR01244 family phosphatase [Gammaproteobacteria bacterium]